MKLIELIEKEIAPIIDSFIYNDESIYLVRYETIGDFRSVEILCQSSLNSFFEFNPDRLTNIEFTNFYENDKYKILCGEGSYGSEGVMSLFDKIKNEYSWLLYLEYSNPFEKIEIKGNDIIAHNNNNEVWKIPINPLKSKF